MWFSLLNKLLKDYEVILDDEKLMKVLFEKKNLIIVTKQKSKKIKCHTSKFFLIKIISFVRSLREFHQNFLVEKVSF